MLAKGSVIESVRLTLLTAWHEARQAGLQPQLGSRQERTATCKRLVKNNDRKKAANCRTFFRSKNNLETKAAERQTTYG